MNGNTCYPSHGVSQSEHVVRGRLPKMFPVVASGGRSFRAANWITIRAYRAAAVVVVVLVVVAVARRLARTCDYNHVAESRRGMDTRRASRAATLLNAT